MQVDHNLTEGDEFMTAADCLATVTAVEGDVAQVKVIGESENEHYDWDSETVAELLINGSLVPEEGNAIDYINA